MSMNHNQVLGHIVAHWAAGDVSWTVHGAHGGDMDLGTARVHGEIIILWETVFVQM